MATPWPQIRFTVRLPLQSGIPQSDLSGIINQWTTWYVGSPLNGSYIDKRENNSFVLYGQQAMYLKKLVDNQNAPFIYEYVDIAAVCEASIPYISPRFVWDADVLSSIDLVDGNVSEWHDLNEDAILRDNFDLGAKKNPVYIPATYPDCNGQLSFNGLNNYVGRGPNIDLIGPYTYFVVVNQLANSLSNTYGCVVWLGDFGSYDNQLAYFDNAVVLINSNGDGEVATGLSSGYHIIAVRYDGGETTNNVTLWVDGGNGVTNPTTSYGSESQMEFMLLGARIFNNYMQGNIAWFGYYDSAIDDVAFNTNLLYLSGRYGVSVEPI